MSDFFGKENYTDNQNYIEPYSAKNTIFMKRVLPVFIAIMLLVSGFLIGFFINSISMTEEERLAKWLLETINKEYLYNLSKEDKDRLLGNMGKGAVYTLDQYSDFYSPSEISELNATFEGEYVGVGFSYGEAEDKNGTFVYVSQVFGSYSTDMPTPADTKLQKYDRFVSMTLYYSDNTYTRLVSKDVSDKFPKTIEFEKEYKNGKIEYAGISEIYYAFEDLPTNVIFDLAIKRAKKDNNGFVILDQEKIVYEEISFELARKVYNPAFVKYNSIPGTKTAVINLMSFMGHAESEIKSAMDQFKKDGNENLILDLRNNGGGSVDVLNGIASYLINDNKNSNNLLVGYSVKKDGTVENYYTKGNYYNSGIKKIVILFNGGTASASEALIGAMKDYGTCSYTIGTLSYGKGIRQGFYKMPGYDYYLKLTDAKMYWPSGTCIHEVKIKPEEVISDSFFASGTDVQMQAALNYLSR